MKLLLSKPYTLPMAIAIAMMIAVILVNVGKPIDHTGAVLPSRAVETLEIQSIAFRASVTAYGNVEPAITLNSKAEVSGKVSYVHPELKRGGSMPEGEIAIRIDAADYKVSLTQTEADLAVSTQAYVQLEEEEKTALKSFDIAKENLTYGEQEYARIQKIWEQRLVSRSTLDAEKQRVNQLRQAVEELQGQLNSFASRKDSVKASIVRAEQQVKGQQTNLGRTEIAIPFNARIGEVLVERGEYVNVGTTLFEALDTNGVEVNAQLPVLHMAALVSHLENSKLADLRQMTSSNTAKMLQLTASISLVGGLSEAIWEAHVLRISESVDPTRRTLGIVVAVDDPYAKIIPGRRPPLLKGMYTAVNLYAPERQAIVIPRKAVHENRVYLVNNNNQLVIRNIDVQFFQGELAIIRSGLNSGDQLILGDLYPVIEGMPLITIPAEEKAQQLRKLARGE